MAAESIGGWQVTAAPCRRVRPKSRAESAIQADIVDFLRAALPASYLPYANANGAQRTASGRAANAVPGLTPGIPDLSVACPGGTILYFEVKRPGGVLSPAQEDIIGRLQKAGGFVAVVTSMDDVEIALRTWGIPLRIARAA